MKNLNEEINRIKTIIFINEQGQAELDKCETDLENAGYKVFSVNELKSTCEENEVIKCVADTLDSKGLKSENFLISSLGSSTKDCYVLVKSVMMISSTPKFHFSFYSDNQIIITIRLNSNNGSKKLLYSGKYNCSGGNITYGQLKYEGVTKDRKSTMVNSELMNSSGDFINVDAVKASEIGIDVGNLKMKDTLTWYLNSIGIHKNVTSSSGIINNNDVVALLK